MTTGPTVLYLIAKGRSGSNILAHFLGQLDGYCNTGELHHLWTWGIQQNALCGCGRPTRDCELWNPVLASPRLAGVDPAEVARWQDQILTWRAVPGLLRDGGDGDPLERYCAVRSSLYRAIADESGAKVVVDASKWPWDPVVLGLVPGVRPVVLHLVRDPRGVAHSWRRRKTWGDREEDATAMPRFGAGSSALSWLARNAVTEWTRRRRPLVPWMLLRYEDFAARPRETMLAIAEHAGHAAEAPFAGDQSMRVSPTHGVGGNPSKFAQGEVEIVPDEEWQTAMPALDRWVASLVSAPLLSHYGYPFNGPR
jgi:Sulfotransferase domain